MCYTFHGVVEMTVGERIKARRKQLGMSAEQLANLIGKSPATIYRYENGDIDRVDSSKLLPIADALGTTPAVLMGWDEPQEFVLTPDERRLIAAYRAADERARADALDTLVKHPAKKESANHG